MKPTVIVAGIGEPGGQVPVSDGAGGYVWAAGLVRLTYFNGSYPPRPPDVSVEWVGPADPGVAALNGDTWINTA